MTSPASYRWGEEESLAALLDMYANDPQTPVRNRLLGLEYLEAHIQHLREQLRRTVALVDTMPEFITPTEQPTHG